MAQRSTPARLCDTLLSSWSMQPASGCRVTKLTTTLRAIASSFGRDSSLTRTHASTIISPHATHSSMCAPNSGCVSMVPSPHNRGSSSVYATSFPLLLVSNQCVREVQPPWLRLAWHPTLSRQLAGGHPTPSIAMCIKTLSSSRPS